MRRMPASVSGPLKSREPRINVTVQARLRIGASWSDACILNVSSRGVLIHAPQPPQRGSYVELRRGDQVIIGRVMWSKGSRAGLRAQDRVPIEAIVTSKAAEGLRLTAPGHRAVERRRTARTNELSRWRARAFEFASIAALGAVLSITLVSVVSRAVAEPLSRVRTALSGQASLAADSR